MNFRKVTNAAPLGAGVGEVMKDAPPTHTTPPAGLRGKGSLSV